MHLSIRPLVVAALVLVTGCRKSGTDGSPKFVRDWTLSPAVFTLTGAQEIDAMGDLHGDVVVAARVLSGAGLITTSTPYHWTGGTRVLVVAGDVIDKGTSALPIIDLLISIEAEAKAAGGHVVVTLGNHEAEFLADPTGSKSALFQDELSSRGFDPSEVAAGGSKYGVWLLNRPVAALVDDWFFCHSGNTNGLSAGAIGHIFQQALTPTSGNATLGFGDSFFLGTNSILEAQLWWQQGPGATPTATIDANLAALPAQHIVFGHEPGDVAFPDDPQGLRGKGQMATRYGGRIFLIDVGMSSAIGNSKGALLRIVRGSPDQATATYVEGTSQILWP